MFPATIFFKERQQERASLVRRILHGEENGMYGGESHNEEDNKKKKKKEKKQRPPFARYKSAAHAMQVLQGDVTRLISLAPHGYVTPWGLARSYGAGRRGSAMNCVSLSLPRYTEAHVSVRRFGSKVTYVALPFLVG